MRDDPGFVSGESGTLYLTETGALILYAQIMGMREDEAPNHLRTRPGLASALARPRNAAHYENADLSLQAAYLAHGIAQSQLFIDGNKRLALVCAVVFLQINGYRLSVHEDTLADWIIDLAGELDVERLGGLIRAHGAPLY